VSASRSVGRRRAPSRTSAAKRRAAAPRRARAAKAARRSRRRRLVLLFVGVLVVAIGIGLWRFDLGGKIEELTLPLEHEDIIRQEAADPDVAHTIDGDIELPPADPALIAAVIFQESKFQDQTSSQGARGLMQITPDTADTIEKLSGGETFVYDDLADPELNIRYGTYYLRYLLHKYDGDEAAALAAYNAGEGNADKWGGKNLDPDDIPFPETRSYVESVLEKRDVYREKYGDELGL
jgi:soluble lytic murein transglycosylase